MKSIDKEYKDSVLASDVELSNKLAEIKETEAAALTANECNYGAKIKAYSTDEAKVQEEWSRCDAEANNIKIESENSSRSANVEAQKTAKETREKKLNTACT